MNISAMQALLETLPGHIGFYCEDTATGELLRFHSGDPIEAASVIKLTVMAEAFRQKAAGQLDFGEEVTIRREDKLPSCGALTYLHDGVTLPWRDLVTLMVILSDNTATNLLIDRLGQEQINRFIDAQGFGGTRLRRKLFHPELARQGIQNTVSAEDMALLLKRLMAGHLVSPDADREMLAILRNQRLNGKMPFYLHSRGIACAHKTGEDDGITHDVGIIYADSPRIFCFLSEETDVPQAELTLQQLARLAAEVPA